MLYRVTIRIDLELDAENEADAKDKAWEELSDYLCHNSVTSLMEINCIAGPA